MFNIVNPRKILSLLVDQKINKEEIRQQLTKPNGKLAESDKNELTNFCYFKIGKKS